MGFHQRAVGLIKDFIRKRSAENGCVKFCMIAMVLNLISLALIKFHLNPPVTMPFVEPTNDRDSTVPWSFFEIIANIVCNSY
jgi:hypothetical protein